ncbi:MAG: hypothetical protein JW830_01390 [Bacteroidales bacterium]|nr:hypothetical protein [Bacteroidales bacterium]
MKQILYSILALLILFQQAYSQQPPDKITTFRLEVLPQYSTYFNSAGVSAKGQLVLSANEKYNSLAAGTKKGIMDNLLKQWQESLVMIQYGSRSELWGWDAGNGTALRIDTWDLNPVLPAAGPIARATAGKIAAHPFFVYLGGQGVLDSDHNLNLAINTRVGFFLLRDRWDLAWTFSGGVLGSIDSSSASTHQFSTGLMSKVYFPIRKLHISPNIGFDLQSVSYNSVEGSSTNSVSHSLLLGISWFVGQGSLDFGVRISKEVNATIGYTLMPRFGKKR